MIRSSNTRWIFSNGCFTPRRRSWSNRKQFDQALVALKESNEMGLEPFARVESDPSMATLRSTPQYAAALKADDEMQTRRCSSANQGPTASAS